MFAVIYNDKIIKISSNLTYVKYNQETNNYSIVKYSDQANGILINDKIYSIPDYSEEEAYKGAPAVEIRYVGEGGDVLLNTYSKSNQNEEDVSMVEDAIIDLDGTNQEDLDDIRQAIFDLAARLENLSSAKG